MSALLRYKEGLLSQLDQVLTVEQPALEQAAELCAQAVASRNVIHIFDTGHLISHELVARVGGLVNFTHFSFSAQVTSDNPYRETRRKPDAFVSLQKLTEWALMQQAVQPGDVLFIGSVSGTSASVVELALQAQSMGVPVIAVTSKNFSSALTASHPSGKRLMDAANVVLDNHAPYGDAFLEIPGQPTPVCPLSGVSSATLMWALTALLVERLQSQGVTPSVYQSVNLPGGMEMYQSLREEYGRTGL